MYVGGANRAPDSRTPRRLATIMNPTATRHRATRNGRRSAKAEVIAPTPAAIDTATVNT